MSVDEAVEWYGRRSSRGITAEDLQSLIAMGLLPVYRHRNKVLLLRDDIEAVEEVAGSVAELDERAFIGSNLFARGIPGVLHVVEGTTVHFVTESGRADLALYPALRGLITYCAPAKLDRGSRTRSIAYVGPTCVETDSDDVEAYVVAQLKRMNLISAGRSSQFARSAHYMGSKQGLVSFLVEGIATWLPAEGLVVDLMCGSGAASAAFVRVWNTVASDGQVFCRTLARVQGGGFSRERAQRLQNRMEEHIRRNVTELTSLLGGLLDWEDQLFHSDLDGSRKREYQRFIETVPTYPGTKCAHAWHPANEIERRARDKTVTPYCLFTAYFANVYFGLRQCVEIDALRFAIDQLEGEEEREWALGALVASLSALGTTYAGHFAQPIVKNVEDMEGNPLRRMVERRAASVIHEFGIRLLNLAEESEKVDRRVQIVTGPWRTALDEAEALCWKGPVCVYLDAPYKREEYSRYYHLLETAVVYSYPTSIGVGRVPDKRRGDRFQSEFFTRNRQRAAGQLGEVILNVLKRGWICAWSYADIGDAGLVDVIKAVVDEVECAVTSVAVPYQHKPQGGRSAKIVTEYLIMFRPRELRWRQGRGR
jgi:hypothetical protein